MVDTRRAALVAAAVVALAALAGCGAFASSPETDLLFVNNDETNHDVTVAVVDDGDVVFEEQQSVEPETDNEFGTVQVSGEYTIRVTVDGEVTERTHEFGDGGTLSLGVQNDGSVIVGG